MSKGLNHLEILENLVELFAHFSFDFTVIEKELKALEIIRNKKVDVLSLLCGCNFDDYNRAHEEKGKLTEEEYELLKEVLEWLR